VPQPDVSGGFFLHYSQSRRILQGLRRISPKNAGSPSLFLRAAGFFHAEVLQSGGKCGIIGMLHAGVMESADVLDSKAPNFRYLPLK
jgi:hypothetical protein